MRIQIKKAADLDATFGKKLALAIKGLRKDGWKRLPQGVTLASQKPAFYLNDGNTLHAYQVDMNKQEIFGRYYCGSADTAIHHPHEQFSKGQEANPGYAIMFIETYYNGRNTSWEITVVSPDIVRQIA